MLPSWDGLGGWGTFFGGLRGISTLSFHSHFYLLQNRSARVHPVNYRPNVNKNKTKITMVVFNLLTKPQPQVKIAWKWDWKKPKQKDLTIYFPRDLNLQNKHKTKKINSKSRSEEIRNKEYTIYTGISAAFGNEKFPSRSYSRNSFA